MSLDVIMYHGRAEIWMTQKQAERYRDISALSNTNTDRTNAERGRETHTNTHKENNACVHKTYIHKSIPTI